MSDETTPGRPYSGSLRQQIASRLGEAWPDLAEDPVHVDQLAAQAMVVVQPYTDRLKAEIRELRTLFDKAEQTLPVEQRRLLSISRMVFDHIAEGRPILTRDEAADLAQRIVDEIGHSVTEEPALGPTFRVEIDQLKATIARVRRMAQVWIDMRPDYPTATREGHGIAYAGEQIVAVIDEPPSP